MEELVLKLNVDSVNAAKSVSELKKIIKDATNEALRFDQGTKSFADFSKVAAQAKDKLNDVRQQMAALDPDAKARSFMKLGGAVVGGFTAATGAMTLFGASTEDAQKALLKVQSAMALLQGFQAVQDGIGAFKDLKGAILSAVGGMSALKTALLATGIGAVVLLVGALAANWDKVKKSIDDLLPGLGGVDKFWSNLKNVAMGTLGAIIEGFKVFGELVKDLFTGDWKELATDAKGFGKRVAAAYNQGYIEEKEAQQKAIDDAEAEKNKEKLEKQREAEEKARKLREEAFQKEMAEGIEHQRLIDEVLAMVKEEDQTENIVNAAVRLAEFNDANLEAIVNAADAENEAKRKANKKWEAQQKVIDNAEKTRLQQLRDFRVNIAQQSFGILIGITELFAGKSSAAQKRAFNIQKAAGIAQTIIDTYVAAQKAYASQIIAGDPTSVIRGAIAAGASVAAGLLKVAKIKATQFDAGAVPSSGGDSGGLPGGGDFSSNVPSGVNFLEQPQTNLGGGNSGTPPPPTHINIKNVISEHEISKVQDSVSAITSQATIG